MSSPSHIVRSALALFPRSFVAAALALGALLTPPTNAIAGPAPLAATAFEDEPNPEPTPDPSPEPQPEPKPEPQPDPPPPVPPPVPDEVLNDEEPEQDATPEPPAEPDQPELEPGEHDYVAVINGTVHTVSGPSLRGATILIKDGKIERVAQGLALPPKTLVIDAEGQQVYPGLVAAESQGILGGGNPADSTNVYNLNMQLALSAGITSMYTGSAVAKNTYGTLDGIQLAPDPFERISFSSRNATRKREFIDALEEARQYIRDQQAYQEAKSKDPETDEKEPSERDLSREARSALRLLRGQATALASAEQASELIELADLADRFGFALVVRGAREGWIVPGALGRADVDVILQTRTRTPADERTNQPTGSNPQTARILHDAGVTVAVIPYGTPLFGGGGSGIAIWGLIGRDLLNLNMAAAFAVRGGMTNEDAIRTITLNAAKILGVDHRVGSIEPGKDADLVITSGDLLSYTTIVRKTIVNGQVLYDQERDGLFAHVRTGEQGQNQDYTEQWPRRLGEPW
ncbi:MAG: amidohydrolase family protein [Phycisphaerales bacterium]